MEYDDKQCSLYTKYLSISVCWLRTRLPGVTHDADQPVRAAGHVETGRGVSGSRVR